MTMKQVIVWRHDLKCRLGKKMAQAGHAAMAPFSQIFSERMGPDCDVSFTMTPQQFEWFVKGQRKIVLRVNSEADLLLLLQRAKEMGLPAHLITDSGLTEWDGPTKTCMSIGPAEDSAIDELTGERGPLGRLEPL